MHKTITNLCQRVQTYKGIFCENNNIKGEMGQFCMLMKLSWNKFKLHCYKFRTFIVIPMETTEKISKSYIQKQMRR